MAKETKQETKTLKVENVPADVLRRIKMASAKKGQTMAQWIIESLEDVLLSEGFAKGK